MCLPNNQLEELKLIEDFTVEMKNSDAGPFHARPWGKAEIETILERTFANGEASFQLGTGNRWIAMFPIKHGIPTSTGLEFTIATDTYTGFYFGAGESRVSLAAIERRTFPVKVLFRNGRASRAHCFPKWWADGTFFWLGYFYPYTLRFGTGFSNTRHPDLHLLSLLSRTFGTHSRSCYRFQQYGRRVTPLQSVVQSDECDV